MDPVRRTNNEAAVISRELQELGKCLMPARVMSRADDVGFARALQPVFDGKLHVRMLVRRPPFGHDWQRRGIHSEVLGHPVHESRLAGRRRELAEHTVEQGAQQPRLALERLVVVPIPGVQPLGVR